MCYINSVEIIKGKIMNYTYNYKCNECGKDIEKGITVKSHYSFMLHKEVVDEVVCPDCFFNVDKEMDD